MFDHRNYIPFWLTLPKHKGDCQYRGQICSVKISSTVKVDDYLQNKATFVSNDTFIVTA